MILKNDVDEWLKSHDFSFRIIHHAKVHHVGDDAPELDGLAIAKCLLLRDAKSSRIFMVAMPGEKRLDIKKLALNLGTSRLQFVKQDLVEGIVGLRPGSVSIFNALLPNFQSEVEMVVDSSLLIENEIGFHPNSNDATVMISPQSIKQYMIMAGKKCTYLEL